MALLVKRCSEKGLADADRADERDVGSSLDEVKRAELCPQLLIEADLGGAVPRLDLLLGTEVRLLAEELGGDAVAATDLVGEQHQQEVLVRDLLLA